MIIALIKWMHIGCNMPEQVTLCSNITKMHYIYIFKNIYCSRSKRMSVVFDIFADTVVM